MSGTEPFGTGWSEAEDQDNFIGISSGDNQVVAVNWNHEVWMRTDGGWS